MRKLLIPIIIVVALVLFNSPVGYAAEKKSSNSTVQDQVIDVSSGIPLVTNEQVVNKMNRMNQEVYFMARGSIGWWMVNILWALVILGIVFKRAWIALLAAIVGFFVVMFGPQIMGYVNHLTRV